MLTSAVARALLICARDDRRQDHVECGEDAAAWLCRLGPGRQRVWRSAAATSGQIHSQEPHSRQGPLVHHRTPWRAMDARHRSTRGKAHALGEIAAGRNLAAVREQQRSVFTFTEVVDRFLEEHGKKVERRTVTEYERLLRRHGVPALGDRPIDTIDRAAFAKLHHSLAATSRQANLLLSVLSKLMGWAASRGLLSAATNPCRGIDRYKENKRERFLSAAELSRLGEALREAEEQQALTPYAIAAIRLLLLTGARKSEILSLRWDCVDLDNRLLRLPRSKTGPSFDRPPRRLLRKS